jgi:hypothetical protein
MTTSDTFIGSNANLLAIVQAYAPAPSTWDFFGILTGLRAYRIHSELDAQSDADLASLGLVRSDLPRVAFEAARIAR